MSRGPIRWQRRAGTPVVAVLAVMCLGVAVALGVSVAGSHRSDPLVVSPRIAKVVRHRRAPVLSIGVRSSRRTVVAGGAVTFRVRIIRAPVGIRLCWQGRFRLAARVWVSVARPLPAGFTATFRPRSTRSSTALLTVRTSTSSRRGTYRIRLTARGRLADRNRHCDGDRDRDDRVSYRTRRAETVVRLTVVPASRATFSIGGSAARLLVPGGAAGIDLRLSNPNGVPLKIEQLMVRIDGVRAPQADASHPCTVADFAVAQFSGSYRFRLPGSRTRRLSELGFPAAQWPTVSMLDRPVNQDGCKRASLMLSYSGIATGWP